MRIGYFADGPWSHRALELIAADSRFEIAFIVPRFDTQDPVLREWAGRLGVEYLVLENVNSATAVSALRTQAADLFVSMSFNQIFKKNILDLPPLGVINCHAGALPFYRGRNILNWVLINDASEFGVTVHFVDEGIDTGDIILQIREPITDADTYGTLLARATAACASALRDALVQFVQGTVIRVPQAEVHPVGAYSGRRQVGDEWIDWNWTSRRIFCFVRAIGEPGPCARTAHEGRELVIEQAALIPGAPAYIGHPGEIVGIGDLGFIVKTGDTSIDIAVVAGAGQNALRVGKRLQSKETYLREQLGEQIRAVASELQRLRATLESGNR